MNGPAHDAPESHILFVADMDVLAALALRTQNDAFRRMAQLLYNEVAIDHGNDNALVHGINGAIDDHEIAGVDSEVRH